MPSIQRKSAACCDPFSVPAARRRRDGFYRGLIVTTGNAILDGVPADNYGTPRQELQEFRQTRAAFIKGLTRHLTPTARIAIVDYLAKQGPHRDDPSLQVGKEEAAKLLAAIGFKPVEDIALFPDKYFVVYGRMSALFISSSVKPRSN